MAEAYTLMRPRTTVHLRPDRGRNGDVGGGSPWPVSGRGSSFPVGRSFILALCWNAAGGVGGLCDVWDDRSRGADCVLT